jgi:hypothetical protein
LSYFTTKIIKINERGWKKHFFAGVEAPASPLPPLLYVCVYIYIYIYIFLISLHEIYEKYPHKRLYWIFLVEIKKRKKKLVQYLSQFYAYKNEY